MDDAQMIAGISPVPRDRRLLAVLLALGLFAVGTLALTPLEQALPPGITVPRFMLMIQPAGLVVAFVLLGWWAAPRVGFGAPVLSALLNKADWQTPLRRAIGPAAIIALLTAGILVIYGRATAAAFSGAPDLPIAAITRLAYGGIGEELIARWGVLTGLMVLALRLGAKSGSGFWLANFGAAALFAAGHFGLLFMLLPHPPMWLIAAVIAGNMVPALGFGWLYRQRGIEAAMLAHGGAHLAGLLAAGLGWV